ncbi:MAG: hypothetical protein SH856_14840 [Flavobacteriales bacterium]|nr:hypothetical protein [Flavobacteriales bacterium]
MATLFQPDLAFEGIDAAWLLDLKTTTDEFDTSLDMQDDATLLREASTRDRIIKGNALNTKILWLAHYGQDFYYSRDSARYNHYIIVEANKTGGQRTGNLPPALARNIDFLKIVGTDIFRFKNKGEHPLEIYFSDTPTGLPTGPLHALAPAADVKKKASELGFSTTKHAPHAPQHRHRPHALRSFPGLASHRSSLSVIGHPSSLSVL